MISYNPTVPTLQQMSFVVIAVKISTDLEVRALMKKYGPASFLIPSKEMLIFLNKESPQYTPAQKMYGLLIDEYKDIFGLNESRSLYVSVLSNSVSCLLLHEHRFTENNLPCILWEELISKKISSLQLPNKTSVSNTKRLSMGLFTAHALGGVYSRQQEKWVSASRVGFETILCCVI
ncbi:hypothetical protein TNCV_4336081 [Trichonephila clavipes]|nr:hypothetical protein TNCV_4336081 [Trichonephila clavipes]